MKTFLPAIFTTLTISILVSQTGCGGGGGGGDDSGGSAGGAGSAASAPQSISGRSVQLSEVDHPDQTLQFASAGNAYLQFITGDGQKSGTYTYSASNNSATLRLIESSTGETTAFSLTFESDSSGSFSYTTSGGASGRGVFRNLSAPSGDVVIQPPPSGSGAGSTPNPTPGGGNSGGPAPGDNTSNPPPGGGSGTGGSPGDNGNNSGNEPGGLNGRVLVLTRSTGQTHTYTFTGNRFVDSDPPEEGNGTYSYTRSGSQATLVLNYTGSNGLVNLAGDRHEIHLTFSNGQRGSYDSTYARNDGTVIPQTGSFEFVQ